MKNEDIVREYSTCYSTLDKDLYKIELYFEERDTFETVKRILLCMNELLDLVHFDKHIQKDKLDYYRKQQRIALNSETQEDNLNIVLSHLKTDLKKSHKEKVIFENFLFVCFQYPDDDWYKYYVLTNFATNLKNIGCQENDIETIIRNHFF